MVKRRTLDEGLTPEEEGFLNPGRKKKSVKAKSGTANPAPPATETETTSKTILSGDADPAPPQSNAPVRANPVPTAPATAQPLWSPSMQLNTRLSAELGTALLTASWSRRMQRMLPFTQQDIVAQALKDWLQANGYLPG